MASNHAASNRSRRATDPPQLSPDQSVPPIDVLLEQVVTNRASDLHIAAGVPPHIRVNGDLRPIPGMPALNAEMAEYLVQSMMTKLQWERFLEEWELDFSFGRRGLGRYRVGAFRERGDASAILRSIPTVPPELSDLGLPPALGALANLQQGLILVTGPSGSGKTTTLTAMISKINRERNVHIITIEDPIEFTHHHEKAIIQQREIGVDTESFGKALRSALREDPDVLLIGEMRDTETVSATVSAAETGHLVFATLHTNNAAQSIDRIVDAFPSRQQTQIRYQLAGSLAGIVSQRLIPAIGGGRVCCAELLIANGAVRNLIREGKTHQMENVMHSGIKEGMTIFDMRLAELVRQRKVLREVALTYAMDPRSFDERLTR
jgi:twitching motility protein PilT